MTAKKRRNTGASRGQAWLLLGISLLWLPLSTLFDGLNALLLPHRLLEAVAEGRQATSLGLLTYGGLLAAMLTQPVAGALSDQWRPSAAGWRGG
ncbi:MAG: hypothetical protein ACRDHL_04760 [Candidatus Promineifilaceae bacterium]